MPNKFEYCRAPGVYMCVSTNILRNIVKFARYAILYVMKKSVLLLLSLMLVVLTGCDFLRAVAGRPTSKDIEEKRIAIIKSEEDALQSRLDSIRLAGEKVIADSLAALDFLKVSGVMMSDQSRIGGLSGTELGYKYYIIVGAFRESANAKKMFTTASENAYSPVLISCRSGMMAVGLCPSNSIAAVAESYKKLIGEEFCPKEAWILVNE